jgi:hypothetical protein
MSRRRWGVEDATSLAVLSMPHSHAAEDDGCDNNCSADERSYNDASDGASRETRITSIISCTCRRAWRRRRCARGEHWRHRDGCRQINAYTARLDVRIHAARVGGVDGARGAKEAKSLQVTVVSAFAGFVFGGIDTAATERVGRVGAAGEVRADFRNCIVTRRAAQIRA